MRMLRHSLNRDLYVSETFSYLVYAKTNSESSSESGSPESSMFAVRIYVKHPFCKFAKIHMIHIENWILLCRV